MKKWVRISRVCGLKENLGLFHETVCVQYEKNIFNEYHDHTENGKVFSDSQNSKISSNASNFASSGKKETIEFLEKWVEFESGEVEVDY